jgi:hypothetical protein
MTTVKKQLLMFVAAALLCLTACTDNLETAPVESSNSPSVSAKDSVNSDARTAASSTADLTSLPKDTGGTHTPYVLWSTAAKYGYYLYTPGGYWSTTQQYPLLIYLHGKSECGDGTSSLTVLNKVLVNGVARLIKDKKWNPKYPRYASILRHDGQSEQLGRRRSFQTESVHRVYDQ